MTKLHFKYKSPENIALLLLNILYEKREFECFDDKIIFNTWRKRFEQPDADDVVLRLMSKLYPDGCMISEHELNSILDASIAFVKVDKFALKLLTETKREMYTSYVYSKYNNEVRKCEFGCHTSTVRDMCFEFFGGELDEFSGEAIKKFISDNFELCGSQLSLSSMANDIAKFYGRRV